MTTTSPGAVLRMLHTYALRTGVFRDGCVIGEYTAAPPSGVCFAVWFNEFGSATEGSGAASTTPLLEATARVYVPAFGKPRDGYEVKILDACDAYLGALNAGFTLSGLVRNVDLLGEQGEPLRWRSGHAVIDSKVSRIADLQIRVVLTTEWTQGE